MIITEDAAAILNSDAEYEERARTWADERAHGATYREIGDRHGVSHERVRQVLKETDIGKASRNWVSQYRKEQEAERITEWLKANGPVPAGMVHDKFGITSTRLSELVTTYNVPKEYIMAGASKHTHSATIEEVAKAVATVWARVQDEEPGTHGLSVGLYDRSRFTGEPSPAMITSRFGWKNVCDAAGVPTAGTGRPVYIPKWSEQDLLTWVGKYTRIQMAAGGKVTFDGYDKWRHTQDGAPSGAAVRTRLRRAGYDSWAAMVAAGTAA